MSAASHLLKSSLFPSSRILLALFLAREDQIIPLSARSKGAGSSGILKCMSSFPRALLPFPFNLSSMLSYGTFVRVI